MAILVTFTYKNRHSGHLRGSITPTLVHTNQDQKNPYIWYITWPIYDSLNFWISKWPFGPLLRQNMAYWPPERFYSNNYSAYQSEPTKSLNLICHMAYIRRFKFSNFQVVILATFKSKNGHSGHLRGSNTNFSSYQSEPTNH